MFENFNLVAEDYGKDFHFENQVKRTIKMDKSLLKQLITILFDNALKYTDSDGQISISVRTTDKNLMVRVLDDGLE